jgi:hypothetical protein
VVSGPPGPAWRPGLEPLRRLAQLRVAHCVMLADLAFRRSLRRAAGNPLRLAHADPAPADAAEYMLGHDSSGAAPWIEVDTTDGCGPALADVVAFVNGRA